jgi:hypothetical protein
MSILEKWKDESLRITNYGSNHWRNKFQKDPPGITVKDMWYFLHFLSIDIVNLESTNPETIYKISSLVSFILDKVHTRSLRYY